MRASIGANDNTRADQSAPLGAVIIVIAVLSTLGWWAVLAIVGLLLGLLA